MSSYLHSPRVTIVAFSSLYRDARVLRQAEYLSRRFDVTVLGYSPPNNVERPGLKMFSLPEKGTRRWQRAIRTLSYLTLGRISTRAFEAWYWGQPGNRTALERICCSRPDVIHANDWDTLPLAVQARMRTGAHIVLDLHEYALDQWDRLYWRVLIVPAIDYFLRRYAPEVTASVTVGAFIARRYADEYALDPIVVMNSPYMKNVPAFRSTEPHSVRLIHHGGAIRSRKLELMIEALAHTDARYSLHLMLVNADDGYLKKLRVLATRLTPGRVSFHSPVSPAEVTTRVSQFDLGLYPLPANTLNQRYALPNKFFDFIAAGLAICTGPSPEMARLSRKYGFGVVAPSFDPRDIAQVLNGLSVVDIDQMKHNACEARKILNADTEMAKLLSLYERVLGSGVAKENVYA